MTIATNGRARTYTGRMATPTVDRPRASTSMLALLTRAQEHGLVMTRMKVAKLLYLADLHAVERTGSAGSGIPWKWLDHGPFHLDLYSIESDLTADGRVEIVPTTNFYGSPEYRLSVREVRRDVIDSADDFMSDIDAVLAEWGSKSATTLKDYTYQTAPMVEAQEGGRRGDYLDLDEAPVVPEISGTLAKFKRVLRRVDADTAADDADYEDILDEPGFDEDFRRFRQRANSTLL